MNCEQALILISAALDGEITPEEREQLNTHLDLCAECRSIAEDFGLLSAALAEEVPVPAELTGRIEWALNGVTQTRKRTFLRRYGSMAAMLAVVVSLSAIVLSGGVGGRDDSAVVKAFNAGLGAFDAKAEMEMAAPAEPAPVPSAPAAKGSTKNGLQYVTADSATFDEGIAEETDENVFDMLTEDSAEVNNYGANPGAAPLEPPASEEPAQFVPPDHATISAALKLVVRELVKSDGLNKPLESDYYYCVLERTENEQTGASGELKLEYAGLSENGKYLTYALRQYTEDTEVASVAIMNNFAVSVELDEVLREYDENRTAEHVREYRAALSN